MIAKKLNKIHFKRGLLWERIANQRREIRREIAPLSNILQSAENIKDKAITYTNKGMDFFIKHPEAMIALIFVVLVKKPGFIFRWMRRGYYTWKIWGIARRNFKIFGF